MAVAAARLSTHPPPALLPGRLPAPSSGCADVDELLEALVAAEEANFSLFNYVNDLSGEVDEIEEGIGGLRWAAWSRGGAELTGAEYLGAGKQLQGPLQRPPPSQ